ncbi:MarR family winged helix-turn-helix transcriptional regulator [Bradyrhizobium iriomotense]|uniref:Transcriptional regulator n=1 Tax=Bradyrhizobium iriomotense TaxID=441950 RepID=A0ABQ6ATG1_9BRAD|nr:MarR family transcriptional regulator [Bradyrhizobium iriomotense]GLR84881.1 transcriptional regulator [Bradyrhizobium iriomotense]
MSATRKDGARHRAVGHLDIIKCFTWEISSINNYLEELRQVWARTLGISGPQWMILMAISDLDKDDGVPVNVVSKLLHVDPSFITTQSKLLEKKGLLRRKPSPTDARVVRLSLTDKTQKHLASLAEQYKAIREYVFEEFDQDELTAFTEKLATLKNRLEKACIRVALDL